MGSPTSWSWNFGDGGTSTVQNPTHTFGAGTYQVSLTASNAGGSNMKTQTVVVSYGGGICTPNGTTLCLMSNRFQVTGQYDTYSSSTFVNATATSFSDNTGLLTTVTVGNVDVVVKMVNFCALNNSWSAYIGGTTDLGVKITITDTNTGRVYTAANPLGTGWDLIRQVAFSCP